MYRILVPVDGSDCAAQAVKFALAFGSRATDTRIHLLTVRSDGGSGPDPLAAAQSSCREAGVHCETHVAHGDVPGAIIDACRKLACDQIVMGGRGMTAMNTLILGSVAMRVTGLASRPVTVVRAECAPPFPLRKALVAVDGSAHADRATQFAVGLAGHLKDCTVHMLNVQEPVVEWQTHGLAREAIAEHRAQLAARVSAGPRVTLERSGVPFEFEWRFGDPASAIVDSARDAVCDQIVMGTRGAGRIENLLIGSVAYKVLHIANLPVTLVK